MLSRGGVSSFSGREFKLSPSLPAIPPGQVPVSSFSGREFKLSWQGFSLELGGDNPPCIMGIINTTPDSFSDGGRFLAIEDAVSHGIALAEQGADILDIGGESSRPFARPVSSREEMDRVVPVIEKLAKCVDLPISIDTVKAEVAEAALNAGAAIINDISAMERDPDMMAIAVKRGVPVVMMHMKGTPATMQLNPCYDDFLQEVTDYLEQRAESAVRAGIEPQNIILDPGIGFGKTVEHNIMLISRLDKISALGFPVLMGPSRKSFISKTLSRKRGRDIATVSKETESGTMGAVAACIMNGTHIVRVHDVASARAVADIVHEIRCLH
ncbi:MAG: dihydropteroate synthase [Desulfamplus sp.]|nr:dihydropteroate synthase [Desulfamplus sp.]